MSYLHNLNPSTASIWVLRTPGRISTYVQTCRDLHTLNFQVSRENHAAKQLLGDPFFQLRRIPNLIHFGASISKHLNSPGAAGCFYHFICKWYGGRRRDSCLCAFVFNLPAPSPLIATKCSGIWAENIMIHNCKHSRKIFHPFLH